MRYIGLAHIFDETARSQFGPLAYGMFAVGKDGIIHIDFIKNETIDLI